MVLADHADYIRCQEEVEQLFRDQDCRAILNLACMGKFSSDRTV
ncbi:glycogen/starch/alpha-glucan phosphorylase [Candidatus Vondammii sp. HM_W22]|nr:glycogen/starch/alpha-glucan phosphorylase [Candidatus Vondammii sp. HM_W22]